jgi:hypothetical protein
MCDNEAKSIPSGSNSSPLSSIALPDIVVTNS